jgi:hypothetical protein
MIRVLQLAKAIQKLGYRPILLYQDFVGGDMRAMRRFWGPDLHFVPYRTGSIRWHLLRTARRLISPESKQYRWALRLRSAVLPGWRRREHLGLHIRLDDCYDERLASHLKVIAERERPSAAVCLEVFMTKSFEALPSTVLRILDTNDLYAVGREQRMAAGEMLSIDLSLEDELRGYRRADVVWAIQGRDGEAIRGAASDVRTATVGHLVELVAPDCEMGLRSKEILMVASQHKWNVQGLRWFAAEVFPRLKDLLPEKNVLIAGDIAARLSSELPFQFLGQLSDLAAAYKRARVVISPILGGAGLKIKNIEAMGYGKAVVSTRFAALGLETAENRAFLAATDAPGFATAIRRLMKDDDLCRRLMEGAFMFAQEYNQEVLVALRQSLEMQRDQARIR